MATSPVLFVYYPPLNDDSWPGVPGRHITEADWASFTIAQRRTIENATTQEGYTRRKVWVHRDLVDETEEERAQREAAEAAARAEYDRKNSLVRYGQIEAMIDQLEVLPPAEEFAALRQDVEAVADVPPRVDAVEAALTGKADTAAVQAVEARMTGIINALSYPGVDPTGATDSYAGLQSFLNDVSLMKATGIIPPGEYRSSGVLDVGSDSTIQMHGATVRNHQTVASGAQPHQHLAVLRLNGVERVVIDGGTLDGRRGSGSLSGEWNHGLSIWGGRDITVRGMTVWDVRGDGIYIRHQGTDTTDAALPKNITIERFRSFNSYRNGGCVYAGRDVTFTDCLFDGTQGVAPQAGFDIEPGPTAGVTIESINFIRCTFSNNAGPGHVTMAQQYATVTQRDIFFDKCRFINNDGVGAYVNSGRQIRFRDCDSIGNAYGYTIGDRGFVDVAIVGGVVQNNAASGINVPNISSGATLISDLVIDGVRVMRNGTRGINIQTTASGSNPTSLRRVTVRNCQLGDPDAPDTQDYGLRLNSGVSGASITANRFGQNATGPALLQDESASRIVANNHGYTPA